MQHDNFVSYVPLHHQNYKQMRKIFLFVLTMIFLSTNTALVQAQGTTGKNQQLEHTIPGTEIDIKLTLIPSGTFTMGSPEEEENREEDEGPQLKVKVDSFWIGTYELTYEQYNIYREKELDTVAEGNEEWNADAITRPSPPYEDPTFGMGKDGFPASSMTQFAALQYCKWLSDKTGIFYRLPTEAEWEYACRAGTETTYYFGDDTDLLEDHAWHYDNSSEKYQLVGQKEPNPWGLYDMLGNVAEWTMDEYKKDAYKTIAEEMADEINPWIRPTSLHPRSVRGGSWDDDIEEHRCAARIKSSFKWKERDPQIPKSYWWNTDSPFVGFRLVRPVNQPTKAEQMDFWMSVLGG